MFLVLHLPGLLLSALPTHLPNLDTGALLGNNAPGKAHALLWACAYQDLPLPHPLVAYGHPIIRYNTTTLRLQYAGLTAVRYKAATRRAARSLEGF